MSPPGQIIPDLATVTQKNAVKVATALRVASLRDTRPDHPMVLQDSTGEWKEIGYCDKFLGSVTQAWFEMRGFVELIGCSIVCDSLQGVQGRWRCSRSGIATTG